MYTLVSAIAEPLGGDSRWKEVSIGSLAMRAIYSTYANAVAVLTNSFLNHPVALDLALIRATWGTSDLTLSQVLASLGSASLPTSDTIPTLATRYARYQDAFRAGYKITPKHPLYAIDMDVPLADKRDLALQREDVDYLDFRKYAMVSVNGYWHQVDSDNLAVYVKDGDVSRQKSGQATIGVFSFKNLGELTYVPITPEMVYKQRPEQQLRHTAYIDVGQDLSDYTVILVLGGYMHVLDKNTFFRTGDRGLAVSVENLPLFERYHESRQMLDFSSLPLQLTNRNDSQVGVSDLLSDACIRAYLTLPQSFIVLLKNTRVFATRYPIRATPAPGVFTSYVKPEWPLVLGYGKNANYWSTFEDGQWSVTTVEDVRARPLYHTVDAKTLNSIGDSRIPGHRHELHTAHFLQLGRDI